MTSIPETNPAHALVALLFVNTFLFLAILIAIFHLARQIDRILAWLHECDDADSDVANVEKDAETATKPLTVAEWMENDRKLSEAEDLLRQSAYRMTAERLRPKDAPPATANPATWRDET